MVGLSRVAKLVGKFRHFKTFIVDTNTFVSMDTKIDTRHKYGHKLSAKWTQIHLCPWTLDTKVDTNTG